MNSARPQPTDEPQLLTRVEVAHKIGISVGHLRRLEKKGLLVPTRGYRNKAFYTLEQVQLMGDKFPIRFRSKSDCRAVYTKDDAMKVFSLLEEGIPHQQIMLRTNLHPRSLFAAISDYMALSGAKLFSGSIMSQINSLPLDANFPIETGVEVLAILTAYAKDRCSGCGKRPKHICKQCAKSMAEDSDL